MAAIEDAGADSQGSASPWRLFKPIRSFTANLLGREINPIVDLEAAQSPVGYPLFAEQLSQDSSVQLFPRFKRARMRLMLAMQYRVAKLEKELGDLDESDQAQSLQIRLTSLEEGKNSDRDKKLVELDFALFEYDEKEVGKLIAPTDNLAQRTQWAMNMPDVGKRGLENAKYLRGVASVAEKETAYTEESRRDLMHIGVVRGRGMEKLTSFAEYLVEKTYKLRERLIGRRTSFIPNPAIRAVARVLAAAMTVLVLLVPVIILNFVHTTVLKFIVIFVAAALFVSAIAAGITAAMGEIFVGGATYAAVLVVFVSQNEI